jgi:DNA-binding transcriptional regulator YiaG
MDDTVTENRVVTEHAPRPEEIAKARSDAALTRKEAAALIYKSATAWKKWELGERRMDPAYWELWKINVRDMRGA